MLQKAKLSRRKVLRLMVYSSLSALILPFTSSCKKNISGEHSGVLKSELDQAIAKVPAIQAVLSKDGTVKIPNAYVHQAGIRFDYILVSSLDNGEYSLEMCKLDIVEKNADYIVAGNVEAYANILKYPSENLKKFNKIDHAGLKHKFITK